MGKPGSQKAKILLAKFPLIAFSPLPLLVFSFRYERFTPHSSVGNVEQLRRFTTDSDSSTGRISKIETRHCSPLVLYRVFAQLLVQRWTWFCMCVFEWKFNGNFCETFSVFEAKHPWKENSKLRFWFASLKIWWQSFFMFFLSLCEIKYFFSLFLLLY